MSIPNTLLTFLSRMDGDLRVSRHGRFAVLEKFGDVCTVERFILMPKGNDSYWQDFDPKSVSVATRRDLVLEAYQRDTCGLEFIATFLNVTRNTVAADIKTMTVPAKTVWTGIRQRK